MVIKDARLTYDAGSLKTTIPYEKAYADPDVLPALRDLAVARKGGEHGEIGKILEAIPPVRLVEAGRNLTELGRLGDPNAARLGVYVHAAAFRLHVEEDDGTKLKNELISSGMREADANNTILKTIEHATVMNEIDDSLGKNQQNKTKLGLYEHLAESLDVETIDNRTPDQLQGGESGNYEIPSAKTLVERMSALIPELSEAERNMSGIAPAQRGLVDAMAVSKSIAADKMDDITMTEPLRKMLLKADKTPMVMHVNYDIYKPYQLHQNSPAILEYKFDTHDYWPVQTPHIRSDSNQLKPQGREHSEYISRKKGQEGTEVVCYNFKSEHYLKDAGGLRPNFRVALILKEDEAEGLYDHLKEHPGEARSFFLAMALSDDGLRPQMIEQFKQEKGTPEYQKIKRERDMLFLDFTKPATVEHHYVVQEGSNWSERSPPTQMAKGIKTIRDETLKDYERELRSKVTEPSEEKSRWWEFWK